MDSKIIASIIIAVGFVAGIYIYVSNTPFNQCIPAYEKGLGHNHAEAIQICLVEIRSN